MSSLLFSPVQVGDLTVPNRVWMAPLTRCRAAPGRVPTALMAEYYRQRASAGLILSEATAVDPMGVGYPDTPGIWSDAQVAGWKTVTEAVHAAGGRIFLQLWHVGRISHPAYLDGADPVAPSAVAAAGHVSLLRPQVPYPVPRALETSEIPGIVAQYRRGAERAKEAGFDGVELHGANGYLLDQFLRADSNLRTDEYGGSIENRARLLLEVTDAAIDVWGAGRVGVHLSPRSVRHDPSGEPLGAVYRHAARELGRRGIAFLFVRESLEEPRVGPAMRQDFGGVFVANDAYTLADAERELAAGNTDVVAWGKLFIANPDLPARLAAGAPLNAPDPSTFYTPGDPGATRGYTDYPRWK